MEQKDIKLQAFQRRFFFFLGERAIFCVFWTPHPILFVSFLFDMARKIQKVVLQKKEISGKADLRPIFLNAKPERAFNLGLDYRIQKSYNCKA